MQPWDFDYELDVAAVQSLAAANGMHGVVKALGAGWDYATFICDGIVIRVPKRKETAALLADELALLQRMPGDLPLAVPRPRDGLVAHPGLPYACMCYPLLAGTPLDEVTQAPDPATLGTSIGRFLARVHGLPPSPSPTGITEQDWSDGALRSRCKHASRRLDEVRDHLDAASRSRALRRLQLPVHVEVASVVLGHHDLNVEHILVDAHGQAAAVIDWGDAGALPWWCDFTGLWLWGGDVAAGAAFDAYGRRPTATEQDCLQQQALLAAISDLHYAVKTGDDAEAQRVRLLRAIEAAV